MESATLFSKKLFTNTAKAIEFINEHHENFYLNYDGKLIRFDKIIFETSRFWIDVYCMVNSERKVSIGWSLSEIQVRV